MNRLRTNRQAFHALIMAIAIDRSANSFSEKKAPGLEAVGTKIIATAAALINGRGQASVAARSRPGALGALRSDRAR